MSFYAPKVPSLRFSHAGFNYSIHIVQDDSPILVIAQETSPGQWIRVSEEWWLVQRDLDRDGGFDSWWAKVLTQINARLRALFGVQEDPGPTEPPVTLQQKVEAKIRAMKIVLVDGIPQVEVTE
jgi:hypothetical protein